MTGLRELERLRVAVRLHPRYAETDRMGVVYHANYLIWFHEARDALLRQLGAEVPALELAGYAFPVVECQCRYLAPAHYGDEVLVSAVPLAERGGGGATVARLRVGYRVQRVRGRRLLAEGRTENVITDRKGRLLLRLPSVLEPVGRLIEAACAGLEES